MPRVPNENVLVGFDTSDDAGVYKLTESLALVQTVDFFTPIVDDPYTFGAIAAANSLSDVYAMGGRPISALSILAYPAKGDLEDLKQIWKLNRALSALGTVEASELLLDRLRHTKSNKEFLNVVDKTLKDSND